MDLYSKEQEILTFAKEVDLKDLSDKDLYNEWQGLLKNYESLLKQVKFITKHSDRQNSKLRRIEKRLKKYVSVQLYQNIIKGRERAETYKTLRKNLTVFFSDIKNFSIITSSMDGETLSKFLNSYLDEMTKIVVKHGGTLDKYIGDAVMVFFGAPGDYSAEENVKRCIDMSLEMREKMKSIRKEWYSMGYEQPFHIRMGIATGWCMVGNFGSSQRMDYTITGRTVNLASRLEQCAEVDEILMCHSTWGVAKDYIVTHTPIERTLKGFNEAKITHQLIDLKSNMASNIRTYSDDGANFKVDTSRISKEELLKVIESFY
jgi:class 3 adenylate cyclase